MTNEHDTSPQNDWNKLAQEALDLWQTHLNALASDPKAREDMANFISPMSQMFAQWSTMMQSGLQGMTPFAESPATAQATEQAAPEADDQTSSPTTDTMPQTPDVSAEATPSETSEVEATPAEDAWQQEIIRAAQVAAKEYIETASILASAPVVEDVVETAVAAKVEQDMLTMTGPRLMAAYADMVDVSELAAPAYGTNTGASFASMRRGLSDDNKAPLQAGAASVANVPTQEDAADAKSDVFATAATPAGGSPTVATGPRDLAELASRLAQLERELDGMRAKNKRGDAADTDAAFDDADDRDAQRMARARQGSASF